VPWPVYTERLLYVKATQGMHTYEVPEGKRAVVKNIMVVDGVQVTGHTETKVHGALVAMFLFPASLRSYSLEMTVVAYERETITVFCGVAGIHVTVSGYLFDDQVGAPPATKPSEPERPELPEPTPTRIAS
jgi:hypothetical protein